MPSSLAARAIRARCSSMAAANAAGPPKLGIWPVRLSRSSTAASIASCTSAAIASRIRDAIAADVHEAMDAAVEERLSLTGQIPNFGGPAAFAAAIDEQRARIARAAKELGIEPTQ